MEEIRIEENLFINLSNHPSSKWGDKQLEAARNWEGMKTRVVDLPFPNIPPSATTYQVMELVTETEEKIKKIIEENSDIVRWPTIMIAGEATFIFAFVTRALQHSFRIITSTAERQVFEVKLPNGSIRKDVVFEFVQFRDFPERDDE